MKHLSDDLLVLHHYGESDEGPETEAHLAECEACRAEYAALARTLARVSAVQPPERPPDYGARVWARLEPGLAAERARREARPWWATATRGWFGPIRPARLALAGGVAALLVVAFLSGRLLQQPAPERARTSPQVRERILLVAVGDHLERSQMMLVELVNAPDASAIDLTAGQRNAEDLVSANRLFRQAALRAGETAVATLLDDLERVLVEIANAPEAMSDAELEDLRQRIEAQGILFKVRITGSQMRSRGTTPPVVRDRTSS
jgi:hypothetical protein